MENLSTDQLHRLYRDIYFRCLRDHAGGTSFGIDMLTINDGWKTAFSRVTAEMARRGAYPFSPAGG